MLSELHNKRIEQGYTVQSISMRLAIPVKNLIAIEEQNINALPPLIYVKGFIKSYAEVLGLKPEPLVAEFSKLYSDIDQPIQSKKKIAFPNFLKVFLIPFAFQTEWVAWVVIVVMLLGSWMGYTQLTTTDSNEMNVIEASILEENIDQNDAQISENTSYRNHDPSAVIAQ
jgi:cytoskeletal protein RodZ